MSLEGDRNESAQSSLPEELRSSTRQRHHALNLQITRRLPLCLPPIADSPFTYTKGMIVFGQIYFAFETFLQTQLASAQLDQRLRQIYQRVCFPWLLRYGRLQKDIETLQSVLPRDQNQELEALDKESSGFRLQIERSLSTRPHVLLAYTWAMYLALFNGGRWIRGQLVSAGPDFWRTGIIPLSFWDFRSEEDAGVDGRLQEQFKEAFREAASLLTETEERDVVEETFILFDMCIQMVEFLDNATNCSPQSVPAEAPALVDSSQLKNSVGAKSMAASFWQCVVSLSKGKKALGVPHDGH
ncbi:hypothetical protein AYO20_07469 [Fonsecaea nubica]|uniref:Heme oxygenase-like protein n=1 Tax=Fonsecaea nubica TaxID=856822 RepID=A0A178CV17_9EURO|nr:hypothetical protein AYO20_07469 [Fonsecaea nubica]OAL33307.1 hypothetical protein AYO20_07469 [Fonsecaea nubica]